MSKLSRKKDILEAATLLFSRKGFRETSMSDLCRMTGVAEGTIFYHFKSKEELFISVLERLKQDILDEFQRYMEENRFRTGLDMVLGVARLYLHLAGLMQDRFLILHRHYPYELAEVNPVCRGHLEEIYKCFLDIFEKAIRKGKEDGSIGDVCAGKTAWILFSMVDGLVRFDTYNLYEAGSLYRELIESCRRILKNEKSRSGSSP
ncbi:MAG: TetR/AcrR family transcriptional regulator [Deltaproteobacteria bacterium]|nr:TetR/AcrR family transcriptional regulator [Deltaproteobacteria bacterium]MBW2017283.1 TetR/AcrR family transcriptional regulator [Deltaproteobacteria bacterium]MBW2129731.1 TetR/AcrR family transcriptional regulator [Deltaproteobacteria bacterium]MBW2304334.1 TetR/AcrR family transcriptional regulator [Deltaproteobacteria bacterium]